MFDLRGIFVRLSNVSVQPNIPEKSLFESGRYNCKCVSANSCGNIAVVGVSIVAAPFSAYIDSKYTEAIELVTCKEVSF